MTAHQLALDDCDPAWDDYLSPDEWDPRWRDLRNQGLTPLQIARIADVQVVGEYL